MSPNKKQGTCCGRSRTDSLKYPAKKSADDGFSRREYSKTILHRLRSRIHCQKIASETVYKVCGGKKRRKKTRPPIKRCFVDRPKRRFQKKRNLRGNITQKLAGDVKSRTVFLRAIQAPDTSVANVPRDTNQRIKSTSLIQSVKDYICSTIAEGSRWATNYVYQTFVESEKKVQHNSSSSRFTAKIDIARRRPKIGNNQQRGDGACECAGNLSDENFGNLPRKVSELSRRKRRRGGRLKIIRYKKVAKKVRGRRARIRNGLALVNSKKPNLDTRKLEIGNDCFNKGDAINFVKKKTEDIGIGEPGNQSINDLLMQISEKGRIKSVKNSRCLSRVGEDIENN